MKVFFLSCFLSACSFAGTQQQSAVEPSIDGRVFEGSYENAAGESVMIPTDKTLVVAFSGKYCMPCNMEIADWKSYLGAIDPEPVKLLTLSIADSQAKTQGWKKEKGAAWEFGTAEDALFNKYCTEGLIPCTLVVKDGVIVNKHIGTASHLTLEVFSGKWK